MTARTMRLLDALRHLALGEGPDPDTGLAQREKALARAVAILTTVFVVLGGALFVILYR